MAAADEMRAYDHLAKLLLDAGGADGVIARSEVDALVEGLRKDGRGTEALAARKLFALIDDFDKWPLSAADPTLPVDDPLDVV